MERTKFTQPEIHPFEIKFIPKGATHLVIGSFPTTMDKMAFNFYYPNSNNKFWKIMCGVFENSKTKLNLKVSKKDSEEEKEKNVQERKLFCRENKFGLTDMISKCFRFKGNSRDELLLVQEYVPILELLKEHNTIHTLILTGNSPATSAHEYLLKIKEHPCLKQERSFN